MCIRTLTIAVLVFVLCTATIMAQSTSGSITGTIVDQQSAAIANATVRVTEEGRTYTLTTTTDGEGRFVFPIVSPGTYTMSVEVAGFKKQERKGVTLVLNDKLSLGNLTLEVGSPTETVEVQAEATLIQADSGERSYSIQSTQVQSLGNKGRSYINFATLAPGVVANGAGDGTSSSSSGISVNGVRTNSNNVQIDGVTSVDTGNNAELSKVPLDSIGEFKLVTSSSQAEYGRSSGAQIIAITQSGTQDFHGSGYYYRRHRGLNANTFQNNRTPVLSPVTNTLVATSRPFSDQEDKGYRIGGPIYIPGFFNTDKKKLFFFVNQEWTPRLTPRTNPNRVRLPTALERRGDFSQSLDSNGNLFNTIRDYTTGLPCLSTATGANPGGCFADGGVLGRIPLARLYGP
ncbi:MAG: carboxypeptidase-like regulatory domain-containing protein, partial [Pyrinomonadaceae bacterium]